ncbi:MAG TPA: DUF4184 family protein [Vicinamibacterales bacterium]|nr:DUF4184 family protein [Vicinamibacterales bacterium]
MPVTPAHAAAAWPLRKIAPRLPLSALVIGAMSPDYEFFLRLAPITRWAHKPAGLLLFCLPVSIAVWFVFRQIVRPALVELLPPGLARALRKPSASWVGALVAVALGALTHVVWDGFTHEHDWAVVTWPVLRDEVAPAVLPRLHWYNVLQHVSTILGLTTLVVWVTGWVRSAPPDARRWSPEQRARAARAVALVALLTLVAATVNAVQATAWLMRLSRFTVGGMIGFSVGLLVLGLGHRATKRVHDADD